MRAEHAYYWRTPRAGEYAIITDGHKMPTLAGQLCRIAQPPVETPTKGLSGASAGDQPCWVELPGKEGIEYQLNLQSLLYENSEIREVRR